MTTPTSFVDWILLLLKLVFVFAPPSVLIWRLLSSISTHSVCFSGQRVSDDGAAASAYRFALQNNEDEPLLGRHTLTIQILDAGGQFAGDALPAVYAGCNRIIRNMDRSRRTWSMTFEELPAYETWTIDCLTNAQSQNIALSVVEEAASQNFVSGAPRLSHTQLRLTADQRSIFVGRRTTPEAWWAASAIVLALGFYCWAIYLFVYRKYQSLTYGDGFGGLGIILFGAALWYLTRRPAPSISQGYWAETPEPPRLDQHLHEAGPAGAD